jgi:hypothetical protein
MMARVTSDPPCLMRGFGFGGKNLPLSVSALAASSPDMCYDACWHDPRCTAFTFTPWKRLLGRRERGKKETRCWLKTSGALKKYGVAREVIVSGVVSDVGRARWASCSVMFQGTCNLPWFREAARALPAPVPVTAQISAPPPRVRAVPVPETAQISAPRPPVRARRRSPVGPLRRTGTRWRACPYLATNATRVERAMSGSPCLMRGLGFQSATLPASGATLATSPASCYDECWRDERCHAFTYTPRGKQRCWLKGEQYHAAPAEVQLKLGIVSGVVSTLGRVKWTECSANGGGSCNMPSFSATAM